MSPGRTFSIRRAPQGVRMQFVPATPKTGRVRLVPERGLRTFVIAFIDAISLVVPTQRLLLNCGASLVNSCSHPVTIFPTRDHLDNMYFVIIIIYLLDSLLIRRHHTSADQASDIRSVLWPLGGLATRISRQSSQNPRLRFRNGQLLWRTCDQPSTRIVALAGS